MDFSFIFDPYIIGVLLSGLGMTLLLSLIAVILGSLLALIPAFMRLSSNKLLKFIATSYVEIIRGTPLLVQVLFIYAAINIPVQSFLGIELSTFVPGMVALLVNYFLPRERLVRWLEACHLRKKDTDHPDD